MSFSVSLAIIARNEARSIARAIDSVLPFVDAAYVADSGSTDNTVEIATSCGANVFSFPWRDDFAAARNAVLDEADSDWTIMIDADEWILRNGNELARLHTTPPNHMGLLQVVSTFDLGDQMATERTFIPRVIPRGVRYAGRVHEQPLSELPQFELPVLVAHDGYEQAQQEHKHDRNERLLRFALAESPADAYLRYQLGKDFEIRGRFVEAIEQYSFALSIHGDDSWRHDLDTRAIYAFKMTGRFREGVSLAEKSLARWPGSADIPFALGDLLLDLALAQPCRASELISLVERAWLHCLDIGEGSPLTGSVSGRGSHLAAMNLANLHLSLGNSREAEYFQNLSLELRASRGT